MREVLQLEQKLGDEGSIVEGFGVGLDRGLLCSCIARFFSTTRPVSQIGHTSSHSVFVETHIRPVNMLPTPAPDLTLKRTCSVRLSQLPQSWVWVEAPLTSRASGRLVHQTIMTFLQVAVEPSFDIRCCPMVSVSNICSVVDLDGARPGVIARLFVYEIWPKARAGVWCGLWESTFVIVAA